MKKLNPKTKWTMAVVLLPALVTLLALAPFPQGIKIIGDLVFQERAAVATTPVAGTGTFYVKNTVPSTPIFVDDTGAEIELGEAGAGGSDPTYGSNAGAADDAVYVDADNDMGIGITTPDAPLHIYSATVAPRIISQYYSTTTGNATEYAATITGTTPGTSPTWVNPTNAGADDASDAFIGKIGSGSADGQTLKLVDMGFAIPSTATVVGVEVAITGSMYNLIAEKDIFLVRGGTPDTGTNKATGATWSNVEAVHTFGGAADDWGGFTAAEVNNAGFGVTFQPTFTGIGNMYIDFITIKVYYSVAGDYTWSTATDILDGAWTIRGNGVDLFRMAYAGGAATFTGVVDADGFKQDGVLYDLSTFGAGGGDVVGPGSSTDYAIPLFNGAGGDLLRNSTLISDAAGNISLGAGDTVDGRELSTDGTKLDGIGAGASVSSVSVSGTDGIDVDSGSPVTTSGTITLGLNGTTTFATLISTASTVTGVAADSLLIADASNAGAMREMLLSDLVLAITSTDNRMTRFDGTTGQVQSTGITVDDSDNVSGMGTLNSHAIPGGTGDLVATTGVQTLTGKRNVPVVTTDSSSPYALNVDNERNLLTVHSSSPATVSAPTGTPNDMEYIEYAIKNVGMSATSITWDAVFKSGEDWALSGAIPEISATTNTWTYARFQWNASAALWHLKAFSIGNPD